jgi:hypothetical protein
MRKRRDEAIRSDGDVLLEASSQLLQELESRVGASVFIGAYSDVQGRMDKFKMDKKKRVAAEAIQDPKAFAIRKVLPSLLDLRRSLLLSLPLSLSLSHRWSTRERNKRPTNEKVTSPLCRMDRSETEDRPPPSCSQITCSGCQMAASELVGSD